MSRSHRKVWEEAKAAGQKLKAYTFDRAFSRCSPGRMTRYALSLNIDQTHIPIEKDKALNERMYGELQGLNKTETAKKFGDAQVKIWRRSYDVPPPRRGKPEGYGRTGAALLRNSHQTLSVERGDDSDSGAWQ